MSQKYLLLVLLVGAVLGVLYATPAGKDAAMHIGSFYEFQKPVDVLPAPVVPDTLAFVGDVMLARNVETVQRNYGADYVFVAMETVPTSTVLIGNFESSIAVDHTQTPDFGFSFSTPTSSILSLKKFGFAYLSLANNHSYDTGADNFAYTQEVISDHDMVPFGDQRLSTSSTTYVELDTKKVALIGLYALTQAPDMDRMQVEMEVAEANSDFQVVYVHWGPEYQLTHSVFQETLAKQLIDLGADAIIGHHPHVVQDIQLYKDVPIFYSLGNFVFDQYFSLDVQEGLWVDIRFENDEPVYNLRPVTALGSYSQPRFMSAYDADRFLKGLSERSAEALQAGILEGVIQVK